MNNTKKKLNHYTNKKKGNETSFTKKRNDMCSLITLRYLNHLTVLLN